jgi:hypothetical protein
VFTAIGLVIFIALAAAVVAVPRLAWVREPLARAAAAGAAALRAGARAAAVPAGALLAGRGHDIPAWRVALFAAVGVLPLVVALAVPFVAPVAAFVDPLWFLAIGLAWPLLLLLAALFSVREGWDYMDGIVPEERRRFAGAEAAAAPPAVLVAIGLVAVYLVAGAWWLVAVHGVPLAAGMPMAPPLAWLLIAVHALPFDLLLSLLDRLTGEDTRIVFGPAVAAGIYYALVRLVGVGIILGLIVVAVERGRQLRRFLAELEASETYRPELVARGRRAPRSIVRGLLEAATTPGDDPRQERLIAAAVEIGLRDFPVQLCARLATLRPELQSLALDRAIELFRYRTREFDAAEALALFAAAAPVFIAGRLELEPTKKLTRLMASVVIFKKDTLKIPAGLKTSVMDALKVELAKPRARDDAALRGILRDLQSALGGQPIIVKPITPGGRDPDDWLRQLNLPPADRAAQPESPSTTVH